MTTSTISVPKTIQERLHPLWLAWQNDRGDESAEILLFQAILAAVGTSTAPSGFQDIADWISSQRPAMVLYLVGKVPQSEGKFMLFRGIKDRVTLEALQSIATSSDWAEPPGRVAPFSFSRGVAIAHARKTCWGGLVLDCKIPTGDLVFVPHALWAPKENLDQEDEVFVCSGPAQERLRFEAYAAQRMRDDALCEGGVPTLTGVCSSHGKAVAGSGSSRGCSSVKASRSSRTSTVSVSSC